jgi:beta-glucanase (GH16 family)
MRNSKIVTNKYFTIIYILLLVVSNGFAQCPTLLWSDEFNGSSLNTNNWNYNVGYPNVNNELETYTSRMQNITVAGGKLLITALQESYQGYGYTSAKINSSGKQSFTYGRFEASIKLPSTQGMWPAFWMMPENSVYGSWPASGEIDIMEEKGSNPYLNFGTIHYGPNSANATSSGGTFTDFNNLSEGFHTYAVEWKPDTINWFLDNHNYYTVTKNSIAPDAWPFDQSFYIIFNLAVGGWFGGNPDGTTIFPQTMEVDYVRVYSNPHTILINGKDVALAGGNYTYSITDPQSTAISWSVPSGSTITNGQGTSTITVNWGNTAGPVSVAVTSTSCGIDTASIVVPVIPNLCKLVFDGFEPGSTPLINFNSVATTGTVYNPNTANPASSAINSSSTVAYYQRNTIQYDLLEYSTEIINNSLDYETGKEALYMDVYTANAPIGTVINWQFENKEIIAKSSYPYGRRAVFVGTTTKQNQWERIQFSLSSTPDVTTSPTAIDQFTFLFDPGNYTSYGFYIDSLMRVTTNGNSCQNTVTALINESVQHQVLVSPNPATDKVNISLQNNGETDIKITLTNMLGIEQFNKTYTATGANFQTSIDISGFKPGMYILFLDQGGKSIQSLKIIVE